MQKRKKSLESVRVEKLLNREKQGYLRREIYCAKLNKRRESKSWKSSMKRWASKMGQLDRKVSSNSLRSLMRRKKHQYLMLVQLVELLLMQTWRGAGRFIKMLGKILREMKSRERNKYTKRKWPSLRKRQSKESWASLNNSKFSQKLQPKLRSRSNRKKMNRKVSWTILRLSKLTDVQRHYIFLKLSCRLLSYF